VVAGRRLDDVTRPTPLQQPRIQSPNLPALADADARDLRAGGSYEASRFTGADVAGRDLSGARFLECELSEWSAHDAVLQAAEFSQVRIDRLNAPTLRAGRTRLREVEILASRMGSVELYDAALSDVVVADSKIGWINLRAGELRDVVFRNCRFDEIDLSGARLNRVAFEGCTAGRLDLAASRLQHVDLRGLRFDAVDGPAGLAGATIDHDQLAMMAEMFATHLGVHVRG